jgi:hypothetical protein
MLRDVPDAAVMVLVIDTSAAFTTFTRITLVSANDMLIPSYALYYSHSLHWFGTW